MERKENVEKLQRRANAALSMDPEPLTEMFLLAEARAREDS